MRVLFHGMPTPAVGDAIRPSTNYGSDIGDRARAELGIKAGEHPPLVFASPHLTHSVAFATTARPAVPLLFGLYDLKREAYFGVFANRDAFMQASLAGAVYAFADDGFARIEHSVNHYAAREAVPLARTKKVAEIKSAFDAMRHGLQIFTLADRLPEEPGDPPLPDLRDFDFASDAGRWVASGKLAWENEARGIHPDAKLREILRGTS